MKTKLKAVPSRREASDKIINHAGFRKKKKKCQQRMLLQQKRNRHPRFKNHLKIYATSFRSR